MPRRPLHRRTPLLVIAALTGTVGLATASVSADERRGNTELRGIAGARVTPEELSEKTEEFVSWAADSHLYAIEAAELAMKQEGMPRVRQAAQMLKADHEKALQVLKGAVKNFDIEV